ncbi:MAG: hypothetical protein PHP45_04240 [Elusimicrobiales bacterium]|nr:hypothetical protein [Elusimicrobiales bacterium]
MVALCVNFEIATVVLSLLLPGIPLFAQQQPAREPAKTESDSIFAEKISELQSGEKKETEKAHGHPRGAARRFRHKAVGYSLGFHHMRRRKHSAPAPLDDEALSIQQFISAHPRHAARLFASELEINKSSQAYVYKAEAESVYGDYRQAEKDYTDAIKLNADAETLRHRAHLYLLQGRFDLAINDLNLSIKNSGGTGGSAPAYQERAFAFYRKGEYVKAADDMREFFRINTDKEYARRIAASRLCKNLLKRGFAVEKCAVSTGTSVETATTAGGEKK